MRSPRKRKSSGAEKLVGHPPQPVDSAANFAKHIKRAAYENRIRDLLGTQRRDELVD